MASSLSGVSGVILRELPHHTQFDLARNSSNRIDLGLMCRDRLRSRVPMAGWTLRLFTSSISNPLLAVVHVGVRAKTNIAWLTRHARGPREVVLVGKGDRPHRPSS